MNIEDFYQLLYSAPDDSGGGGESPDETPDEEGKTFTADYVQKLRDENKKHRLKAKDLEEKLTRLEALEGKLKTVLGDEEEDPAERLAALEKENRTLKLERMISIGSRKHNADSDLAGAYLIHKGLITADMKPEEVEEEIKKAVEANPRLRAEKPKSVGDGTPTDNGSSQPSMNDFIRAAAKRN